MSRDKMVLIPNGSFEMGDHVDSTSDALPVHTVELNAFYMDVHPITVGKFRKFVEESGYNYTRKIVDEDGYNYSQNNWSNVAKYSPTDEHPMVYVTWSDANSYAEWAEKRLPTEAEWEYAARGGLSGKRYPWGDEITPTDANFLGTDGPTPVGNYDANAYGLYDMGGNVWEWCADWYAKDYYVNSPTKNPIGAEMAQYRVARGGSWCNDTRTLRVADRNHDAPTGNSYCVGFRCVVGCSGR